MRPLNLSICVRVALFAGLGIAAYWTGRWQETLAQKTPPEPRIHNAASLELAAKAAARAKAETAYQKLVEDSAPDADDNGINLAKDLKGGLAKLAAMPTGEEAQDAYRDAFSGWAFKPAHSAEAAAAAQALPPSLERTAALKGVASGWALADPKGSLEWAGNLPVANAEVLKEAIAAASDPGNDNRQPALAAQYVSKLQDATLRNEAIAEVAKNWANGLPNSGEGGEPSAALDWLNQVATGETYDKTVNDIFRTLSDDNPTLAAAMIDKVTDPSARQDAIADVVHGLRTQGYNIALQWIQSLPDTDQKGKDQATKMVVLTMFNEDPSAGMAYLQNSPEAAKLLPAVVSNPEVIDKVDPPTALGWINSLPESRNKNEALNTVLTHMAESDFAGAWNYAATLPAGAAANDDADNGPTGSIQDTLISVLTHQDPAKAVAEITQMPTEAAQLSATSAVAGTWVVEDEPGFVKWVNGLPPGQQHDAAVTAALDSIKNYKQGMNDLPAAERASLLQSLNQAIKSKPAP